MKVIWSPLAEQRAMEAVDYIAQERPQAAAAWLEDLIDRIDARQVAILAIRHGRRAWGPAEVATS